MSPGLFANKPTARSGLAPSTQRGLKITNGGLQCWRGDGCSVFLPSHEGSGTLRRLPWHRPASLSARALTPSPPGCPATQAQCDGHVSVPGMGQVGQLSSGSCQPSHLVIRKLSNKRCMI